MNNARLKYLIFIYIDLKVNLAISDSLITMKIPKEIKIRNSTILVSTVNRKEAERDNYLGIYDTNENTIKISKGITDKKLLCDVLIHEIIHAILDKGNKKIRSEEPTVDFIATQFVKVLDRNKELIGFIKRCLK